MIARVALIAAVIAAVAVAAALLEQEPTQPELPAAPAAAQPDDRQACRQAVDEARRVAETLLPDDLSRRYAEVDLNSALIEGEGGEFQDCRELTERAVETVRTHPYALRPGQTLDGEPSASASPPD